MSVVNSTQINRDDRCFLKISPKIPCLFAYIRVLFLSFLTTRPTRHNTQYGESDVDQLH